MTTSPWSAVAAGAEGKDPKRHELAVHLLSFLSASQCDFFWGVMLADLSVELYFWVATGDEGDPDASTVTEHVEQLRSHQDVLFLQGHMLKMGTHTWV